MNVLIFGYRRWAHPEAVSAVLASAWARHGQLELWEGCAQGADGAACRWGRANLLFGERHHFPIDWVSARRTRPDDFRLVGLERNQRMLDDFLAHEGPRFICGFHEYLNPVKGGTSDMMARALLAGQQVWLVDGPDPHANGHWVRQDWLDQVPSWRLESIKATACHIR